ncbi:MAG: tRNA (guanosine(37)-N1)-methyltransferase TrmD [candidate division Zixibacteria bacterium]|nr:tRNA (guanosine(37)-N1)-methyltransferase TrmD [candidate division Zixibacteria bacterium]
MGLSIDIVTAFPGMFTGFLGESLMARAMSQGVLTVRVHDLRDYSDDPVHRSLDDTPFGGGGGMILKAEPIARAVEAIGPQATCIIPTAQGPLFNQRVADDLAALPHLIFVCGHYTGMDERVFTHLRPWRLSLGNYVLSGGELPAMVMTEAIARRLPGFLGNDDSARGDSFVRAQGGLGSPQYTRPAEWRGLKVPDILVSGHHAQVAAWRDQTAEEMTRRYRPDLPLSAAASPADRSGSGKTGQRNVYDHDRDHDVGGEG